MSAATTYELDERTVAGETIRLEWDGNATVSLTVHRMVPDLDGTMIRLVTATVPDIPHDKAWDAFQHPYAYAAHSGSITLPDRASTYIDEDDGALDGAFTLDDDEKEMV